MFQKDLIYELVIYGAKDYGGAFGIFMSQVREVVYTVEIFESYIKSLPHE